MNYKKFRSVNGFEIVAGQDDQSNDYLSLKEAQPDDYWFHVHGFPGSHVILRCSEMNPSKEDISQAAAVAAWFSKMRKGKNVTVQYLLAKEVKKARKSPAGQVQIKNFKKIKVNPAIPDEQ